MLAHAVQTSPLSADEGDLSLIHSTIEHYRMQLVAHPLARVLRKERIPERLLSELATGLFSECVLRGPALALIKDTVTNPRLSRTLKELLLREVGIFEVSHLTLCRRLIESLGVSAQLELGRDGTHTHGHAATFINSSSGLDEGELIGFLLAGECLRPAYLSLMQNAFAHHEDTDDAFIRENVPLEQNSGVASLKENLEESLVTGISVEVLLEGIHISGRAMLQFPDQLYAKFIRREFR